MAAERRARGRKASGVGNDDDDDDEKVERQECDLERQPLLVAREERARKWWRLMELFTFNYGTV